MNTRRDVLNHLIQLHEDYTELGGLHWNLGNIQLGWEYMDRAEQVWNEFNRLYQI
jgi:hypothetical protein